VGHAPDEQITPDSRLIFHSKYHAHCLRLVFFTAERP